MDFIGSVKLDGNVLCDKRNTNFLTYKTLLKRTDSANVLLKNEKDPTELMKAVKNETELKNIREVYLKDF